jgi:hypothetical protein
MRDDLRRLIPPLIEVVPVAGAPEPPKQRLSRIGQAVVASGIALLGLGTYMVSCAFGSYLAQSLQFCPILNDKSYQKGSLEALTVLSRGDSTNMLIWNYRMNDELIRELKGASRGQQLILKQQNASLTMRLSRQCHLARHYRIQLGGLGAVSTGAAVILVITGIIRMPKGIGEVSRCEQAILVSSLSLLVLTIGYMSLGGSQELAKANWEHHKMGIELLSQFRGSLANSQLLIPKESDSTAPPSEQPAIPLNNPASIAELVKRFDEKLLTINHGSVKLNTSFARQAYEKFLQEQEQQQPESPLPSSP